MRQIVSTNSEIIQAKDSDVKKGIIVFNLFGEFVGMVKTETSITRVYITHPVIVTTIGHVADTVEKLIQLNEKFKFYQL